MDRSNRQDILERLQQEGVWSKKQLGQHFLISPSVLQTIIQAAELKAADTVVEIGPGLGVLTEQLLPRVKRLISFEYDPEMVAILRTDFPELEIVAGDVLQTASQVIPSLAHYKLVANIPYQITSLILKLFLEGEVGTPPESLTLLVQKEVGQRLTAQPRQPQRSYLSVLCQYYAEVQLVKIVQAAAFWPVPKVDSAVIHLERRSSFIVPEDEKKAFLRFVHTAFRQQRKQLKNVLAGMRGLESEEVVKQFAALGLAATVRAQELSLEQWRDLYLAKV